MFSLSDAKEAFIWVIIILGGGGGALLAGRRGIAKVHDVETDTNTKRDFMATLMSDGKDARERTEALDDELRKKIEENGALVGKVAYLEGRVKDLDTTVKELKEERDGLRLERHDLANRVQVLEAKLNRILRRHGTTTDFREEGP